MTDPTIGHDIVVLRISQDCMNATGIKPCRAIIGFVIGLIMMIRQTRYLIDFLQDI